MNNSTLVALEWLASNTKPNGGMCAGFAPMVRDLELDRAKVRRACRLLARQGYAEFHRALCTEDGDFAGSGYCISKAGLVKLERELES